MKVWRVTHPQWMADKHFRTRAEAVRLCRDLKLEQMREGIKPRDRIVPTLSEITLPPLDMNLIVDMLNGRDYVISVRVVNTPRQRS